MIYVQFYDYDLSGKLSEPCGDRAVIVVDGRLSRANIGTIAAKECLKREYAAWRVFKGDSFTSSRPISCLWFVSRDEPVRDPVYLSAIAS